MQKITVPRVKKYTALFVLLVLLHKGLEDLEQGDIYNSEIRQNFGNAHPEELHRV